MDAPEEKGFRARESELRQTILKAVAAFSVMVASLLLFLVMPLFPRELMVLAAISLGVLAFKAPTPALLLMMLLALPGYVYQLGSALPPGAHLPVPMVAVMSAVLLVTTVVAGEKGGTLGIAAGATAAILMLTPLQFLALPMLIGTTLFRTKGVQIRAASTILTFVILYYPILALNAGAASGGPLPMFEPVLFHAKPPISVLNMHEVTTKLGQVVSAPNIVSASNSGHVVPYLANLAEYWPLSLKARLLPVGLLFGILMGAAIAAAGGMLILFRWLEKREVGHAHLAYAAPASSLLAGVLAFVSLASLLARPLAYTNTMNIPTLVIGAVLVGGPASLVEVWLRRRDLMLDLRERLADGASAVYAHANFLMDRTRQTKAHCQRMDTTAEEALRQMCQQELAFAEQAVADMSVTDLEQKVALFQELQGKLHAAVQESNAKLCAYYDEDRQKYNNYVSLAEGYGFPLGECVEGPAFSQLISMEYTEVLKLQTDLNDRYQTSARSLAEGIGKLEGRLCSEVDPEFKRTGIHIARDYFAEERYAEALQEFLLELKDIEYVVLSTITGLDKEILSALDSLKAILADTLMPTAINLGDASSVSYYREVMSTIASLYDLPGDNARLPDLMRTVGKVGELGELIAALSSRLGDKIATLEESIQNKTPRGHSWGIDPEIRYRAAEVSRTIKKPPRPVGIHDRMSLVKSSLAAVDTAARAVRDYSVTHELLINYANIEYLLEEKLYEEGEVSGDDLPVKRKYSRDYLELYRQKHPGEVYVEKDTGRLRRLRVSQVASKTAG